MQFSSVLQISSRGASNVSPSKDTFTVTLQPPLHLPRAAYNVYIQVTSAAVWNTSPNIIAGVNDKIYTRVDSNGPWYFFTIPQGQYGVSELNSAIVRGLQNVGLGGAWTISGDAPTQRVVINLNNQNSEIDFTQPDTPRVLMGFNSQLIVTQALTHIYSDNEARFNNINSFSIRCDLVDSGISLNGVTAQSIATVPITAAPGSLIVYNPTNPLRIPADRLAFGPQQTITVKITDENGGDVFLIDDWGFVMEIMYSVPLPQHNDRIERARGWY